MMVISLVYKSCWHIQWLFTWLIENFGIHGLQENTIILSFIWKHNFFPLVDIYNYAVKNKCEC